MQKFTNIGLFLVILALLFSGCGKDDNPVAPEKPDHAEAVGCVIKQGDAEIVRAEKGAVTGQFTIQERVQSALMSFYLIAADGALFRPEEAEYLFAWESKNSDIADIIQYETDGPWEFRVKGFDPGQTGVVFKVLHGDHEDFVSLDIAIQVSEGAGGGLGKK